MNTRANTESTDDLSVEQVEMLASLRRQIHAIVKESWSGVAREFRPASLEAVAPELNQHVREIVDRSIEPVFKEHFRAIIREDLLQRIILECVEEISRYLREAIGAGLVDRYSRELHMRLERLFSDRLPEILESQTAKIKPDRRIVLKRGSETYALNQIPPKALPPTAGVETKDIPSGTVKGGEPMRGEPATQAGTADGPRELTAEQSNAAENALQVERGHLVERIPRNMHVGVREVVEVRLGLPDAGLAVGMLGRGSLTEHPVWVVETMSLKLHSPDGAFEIEALSPETQLVKKGALGNTPLASVIANFGRWIWVVTPKQRGTQILQLSIAASVRDARGLQGNASLPDQSIQVDVAISLGLTSRKFASWLLSAGATGVATGVFATITRDHWWPVVRTWLPLP